MRPRLITILLLALALSGCMGVAGIIEQLKDDPATVCASYVGLYGNLQVSRTVALNAKVTCSKDGLTVESVAGPVSASVPEAPTRKK